MDQAGFRFRTAIAEPGRHEILNRVYGAERPTLDHIREALHDVALHPDTARHLSRKLIVGAPAPEDWIASMANAYLETDGHLPSLYRALLDDPRAWQMPFQKVKTPFEFVVSALRAAGASEANIRDLSGQELRRGVVGPLEAMGQPPLRPPGPDG